MLASRIVTGGSGAESIRSEGSAQEDGSEARCCAIVGLAGSLAGAHPITAGYAPSASRLPPARSNVSWLMLKVGDAAPDFTITLGSGEQFILSEQRGNNVVLYFYPRAFTHGCKVQTKKFGEAYDDFREHNAIVLGISTDGVERLRRFGEACENAVRARKR